jgi:hypothetical protein
LLDLRENCNTNGNRNSHDVMFLEQKDLVPDKGGGSNLKILAKQSQDPPE